MIDLGVGNFIQNLSPKSSLSSEAQKVP